MKHLIFLLIFSIFFIGKLNATQYFVDADNGCDDSLGTSEIRAWKTINKVNSGPTSGYQAYDIISFKCGTRIYGQTLMPPSSYLLFNSYYEGARPVIDRYNESEYNGSSGSRGGYCVSMDSKDYITFKGLKLVNGRSWRIGEFDGDGGNVNMWNCNYITFDSCNIDSAYNVPSHADYSAGSVTMNIYSGIGRCLTVRNCTMNYAGGSHGIYIDGTDSTLFENNTLMYNAHDGIRIAFGNDSCWTDTLTVRYCSSMYNHYAAIEEDGARDSKIYYNVFENNPINNSNFGNNNIVVQIHQDTSYHCPQSNVYWTNNTFIAHDDVGSSRPMIWIETTSGMQNIVFKNNIFNYDPNVTKGLIMDAEDYTPSLGNFVFENNCYYKKGSPIDLLFERFDKGGFSTLSAWQNPTTGTGYEANSIETDPKFNTGSGYSLKNSSPALLAGVGVGFTQDIIGNAVDDPPDIGAYQKSSYISGFLPTQTLSGNVAITNSVVVPSGNTLTISPGTHIKLKNYTSITVYGTLDCHYDSEQGDITFDLYPNFESFEGDTIWFMVFFGAPSSSSILQHATINHNYRTLCLLGANISITNCNFLNSTEGIYFYNSAPSIMNNIINNPRYYGLSGEASGLSIWIQGNTITRTTTPRQYRGIYLWNNTNSILWKNYITGFDYGAYFDDGCWTGSNGDFFECNNIITDNNYGITTARGSWTNLGDDDGYKTMSGIYNNLPYDVVTKEGSGFVSFYNYFGTDPQIFTDTTTYHYVEFEGNQSTFPCGNQSNNSTKNNVLTNNSLHKSTEDNYLDGLRLEKEGKIDEAINFYKDQIQKDVFVKASLSKLASIKNKYSKPELTGYFQSLITTHPKYYGIIKNLIGDIYLQNDRFDDAITAFDNVINHSKTDHDGINARFEKLFAYLHIKNDSSTASQILSEIKGINSNDEEVQIRITIAEDLIKGSKKGLNKNVNLANVNIPKSYELYQNYPNPFNPVTTIRYQIPKPGTVTLKVYDILGREVATLVNENKIEGIYEFSFNASRFASGVYIYQLRANDYVSSKKMIMLK